MGRCLVVSRCEQNEDFGETGDTNQDTKKHPKRRQQNETSLLLYRRI